MGELIRKLGEISIGESTFDVELNEGYSRGSDDCIHIQNRSFRYQLSVKEFYQAATHVKQARFDMVSDKRRLSDSAGKGKTGYSPSGQEHLAAIKRICGILSAEQMEYRYVGGVENCLTFLLQPAFTGKVRQVFRKNGFAEYQHPMGETNGYTFLYQMEPFQLYKAGECYVEVFFQIPCMSLTEKTWIPLDKLVQKRAFETKKPGADGVSELDDEVRVILALSWAILKRRCFLDYEIDYIQANQALFAQEEFREMMEKVFFGFTDTLVGLIENDAFDRIVGEYYNNRNY